MFFSWPVTRLNGTCEKLWIAGTADLLLLEAPADGNRRHARLYDWKSGKITRAMKQAVTESKYDNKLGAACLQQMLYMFILRQTYGIYVTHCELIFFSSTATQVHVVKMESDDVIMQWLATIARTTDRTRMESVTITNSVDELPFQVVSLGTGEGSVAADASDA